MQSVNIYLTFNGNCEVAFNFYQSIFGNEFQSFNRFKEMPVQEGQPAMPPELGEKLMHISLPLTDNFVLMGSDTGGEWAANFMQGNNFSISLRTENKEEADRLFNQLAVDGKITMPMADTFWGDYFGSLTDQFGINWMLACS